MMLKSQPEVGKWSFYFGIRPDLMRLESYSRVVEFILAKPLVLPQEGAEFRRGEYKGVICRFRFWFPITIDRWR